MPSIEKLRGRVWTFGDFMDVDWEIFPTKVSFQWRESGTPITNELLGKYCMTKVDPDFPNKVKKGDFIVAGQNFGCGHDHYHACGAIRGAGISAVICESSNTNFIRNSIHNALPVIVCKGIKEKTKEGDELEVDLLAGTIVNLTTGEKLQFIPLPDFLIEIIEAEGLYPYLRKQISEGKA
ncbi:3-isopropylmalate dehydratase [Chloroflexota bacterium]